MAGKDGFLTRLRRALAERAPAGYEIHGALTLANIQRAMKRAIVETLGVELRDSKVINFTERVEVRISPGAHEVLVRTWTQAITHVERTLPKELAQERWQVKGASLSLDVRVDETLEGTQVKCLGGPSPAHRGGETHSTSSGPVRIHVLGREHSVELEPGTDVTIGRTGAAAHIEIDDAAVSAAHLRISYRLHAGGRTSLVATQLGSTNPTTLDGQVLTPGVPTPVSHGSLLVLVPRTGEGSSGAQGHRIRITIGDGYSGKTSPLVEF